ncbi:MULTISPECIES: NAD(P)-dependent oxidoreductase [Prauserella salsuginis group]|uniref:NAD(P)-dependent oxidoreductase n=1 Tax=Prauserella salsuginis TaxID=387889 RepID=A0ABW6G0X9_9PSEU|nr:MULTISPECIES: NAD(P)-dependent oxidoreductase [Prauserella salsuginis group]MCR3722009.1 3-hydroxyisobutyrate dehydrogenase [Prauserella flava]MCR3736015.1 3-hydroxyisobutyrate dehydrogenase [Prauserella salsuginis]
MTLPTPPAITFVGIGAIGLPMATQLARAGADVTAVDTDPDRLQHAAGEGMRTTTDTASVDEAEAVMCMVATAEQLRTITLGPDGVLARMTPGSTLVVMSTVGPDAVTELVAGAPEGVSVLDVPVTGGVSRARTGELLLFGSGPPEALARLRPALDALGQVIHCGAEAGRGQAMKAVNQLLCSVHLVAAAEALALAEALGLDPAEVLPAVAGGAGGSWMLSDRGHRMLQGPDTEVTSAVSIFVKDSGLVADVAATAGLDTPLLEAAAARFRAAADAGLAEQDDSQVIRTYCALTPTSFAHNDPATDLTTGDTR